jgi:CubicO group peptidase (beta-lactamase class C family)
LWPHAINRRLIQALQSVFPNSKHIITMTADKTPPNLGPANAGRRHFLEMAGAGLLAASLPACGGSEDSTPAYGQTIDWGQRAITQAMSELPDAAAISVALLKGDRIVWQQAFGKASVTDNTSATIRTRFNIGSVSKVLAGLTGVMLQDRGLINLDTPIVRYLPEFKMLSPAYANITSRHLLSHASGLPGTNGRNVFAFAPIPGYSADTERELANAHLKHLPGQLAVYNNDGFTLFERVVLAVTGLDYPDFVEEHILKPLNMADSSFLRSPNPVGEFAYPQYRGKQYPQEFVNAFATGGVSTTPSDTMNLARMFLGGGGVPGCAHRVCRGHRVDGDGPDEEPVDQPFARMALGAGLGQRPAARACPSECRCLGKERRHRVFRHRILCPAGRQDGPAVDRQLGVWRQGARHRRGHPDACASGGRQHQRAARHGRPYRATAGNTSRRVGCRRHLRQLQSAGAGNRGARTAA